MPFAALLANPLVRKAALYGAIALGGLLLLRWYSNAQYSKGFDKGRVSGVEDTVKQHQAEWKVQQEELDGLREGLVKEHAAIEAEKKAVVTSRTAIVNNLAAGQAKLGQKIDALRNDVALVPADQLDIEIRKQLEQLR